MTTEKKEPKIGDIIRIVSGISGNIERMGRVEDFIINEFGYFIKLSGHESKINIEAIKEWQFLKIDNEKN